MKQKTNKKTIEKNQRNTNLVVWKDNKTGKALVWLMTKKKKEKSQIDNIRNERRVIITDSLNEWRQPWSKGQL